MNREFSYVMQSENCYLKREKGTDATFEVTMLLQNSLRGLLPCKEQQRNGEDFLLYDVTSKKALSDLWEDRSLDEENMRGLLQEVIHILRECDRYLLDRAKVILDPEMIFCSQETSQFLFLYDPFAEQTGADNLGRMAEFLVERADYEKEGAVNLSYRVYEAVHSANFTIRTLQECLEYRPIREERVWEQETPEEVPDQEAEREMEEKKFDARMVLPKIILGISFLVLGVVVFLLVRYELTWREQILLSMAAVAGVAAFILGVWDLLRQRGLISEREQKEQQKEPFLTQSQEEPAKTLYIRQEEYLENRGLQGMGEQNALWISLAELPCTIGKKKGFVDYLLEVETISRIHARFSKEDGKIWVTDLHSTNGTYVNGIRIEPDQKVELRLGDQVSFGKMNFTYC